MGESNNELPDKVTVTQDLGKYTQSEFVKQADIKQLQLFVCPTCGKTHFRHAGYVLAMLPFIDKQEPKVATDPLQVFICVSCKTAVINRDGNLHDVTKHVDLNAWEKTEKEAHKATGPGGQC